MLPTIVEQKGGWGGVSFASRSNIGNTFIELQKKKKAIKITHFLQRYHYNNTKQDLTSKYRVGLRWRLCAWDRKTVLKRGPLSERPKRRSLWGTIGVFWAGYWPFLEQTKSVVSYCIPERHSFQTMPQQNLPLSRPALQPLAKSFFLLRSVHPGWQVALHPAGRENEPACIDLHPSHPGPRSTDGHLPARLLQQETFEPDRRGRGCSAVLTALRQPCCGFAANLGSCGSSPLPAPVHKSLGPLADPFHRLATDPVPVLHSTGESWMHQRYA